MAAPPRRNERPRQLLPAGLHRSSQQAGHPGRPGAGCSVARACRPAPSRACAGGRFRPCHLKAIHRHLFQDIYAWAGEVRTVEIAKGGSRFQPRRFIATGMADVHRRIVAAEYFRGLGPDGFAAGAGSVLGDVNQVHPFREGNGRTQFQYLKQLAARAGHTIILTRIDRTAWLDALRRSDTGDYEAMTRCIRQALS